MHKHDLHPSTMGIHVPTDRSLNRQRLAPHDRHHAHDASTDAGMEELESADPEQSRQENVADAAGWERY